MGQSLYLLKRDLDGLHLPEVRTRFGGWEETRHHVRRDELSQSQGGVN